MSLQVLGIDHIYIAVADLPRSIAFYDAVMRLLGFRKGTTPVGRLPHVHYYNRAVQYTLRPARTGAAAHDPEIPGLHHVCFQVADRDAVDEAALGLAALGIEVKTPQLYPEYGADYYALYFKDPDGIQLEIVSRTRRRDLIRDHWGELSEFEDPLSKAGLL